MGGTRDSGLVSGGFPQHPAPSTTTLSYGGRFRLRIMLPQYAHSPVQVNNRRWISRRVCGRVHPEVFFAPQPFQGQEGMRQHDQGDMMMPTCPTAAFVMIQPQFLLELLIILFDLPAGFDDAHQAPQSVVLRQVAEKVFRGFFLAARPFHQQPDFLVRGSALVESMRGLHAASIEAGLEPAFAAFSPAHLLPPAGLLRHLPDGAWPLRAVVISARRTAL